MSGFHELGHKYHDINSQQACDIAKIILNDEQFI